MMTHENKLAGQVQFLLSQWEKHRGALEPPIDPIELARFCGILGIERRPMVPEAVLSPVEGGFKIYLQNNFVHRPSYELRERFTLAHELVHTFFFDLDGRVPKPKKGAPTGLKLEGLCHSGASQILIPEGLLRGEIRDRGLVESAESILDLARVFSVSTAVMIRRLHELEITSDGTFAAILVDTPDEGNRLIQAACYGPLLLCHTKPPKWGSDYDAWVLPLLASENQQASEWRLTTSVASITAKKVYRSNRSFILDLRFGPPEWRTT